MATSMFDVDGTYQHIRRPEPHKLTTVSPGVGTKTARSRDVQLSNKPLPSQDVSSEA
jgi:hypothetical protein